MDSMESGDSAGGGKCSYCKNQATHKARARCRDNCRKRIRNSKCRGRAGNCNEPVMDQAKHGGSVLGFDVNNLKTSNFKKLK